MSLLDDSLGRTPRHCRLAELSRADGALLRDLVSVTRTAFAEGDMLPGLPTADGALDTHASVTADLAAGVRVWMAHGGDREPVGFVRAIPRDASLWQIRRLAVRPELQGRGLGRLIIRALEDAARAEGVRRLVVWALVERGIAPLYSALGYRTTGHIPTPDKALSEAVMEIDLDAPRTALPYPWGTEPRLALEGPMVSWFGGDGATYAVLGGMGPDPARTVRAQEALVAGRAGPVRYLGGDGWPDGSAADRAALAERLAAGADAADGPLLTFAAPFDRVRAFTLPRAASPDLLALWRVPVPRRRS